jgi:hypothetical protein
MYRSVRLLPVVCLLALAACSSGDVADTLGLNKEAPDEFVVVSRPPLSLPPDFELSPPRPGAEGPNAINTQNEARKLLLGTDTPAASLDELQVPTGDTAVTPVLTSDAPTAASASFLKSIGADAASPDIRLQLGEDITAIPEKKESQTLYEDWLNEDAGEPVVDPAKESERLRSNKDEGKPITEGDTPTVDEKPKSVIDKVF